MACCVTHIDGSASLPCRCCSRPLDHSHLIYRYVELDTEVTNIGRTYTIDTSKCSMSTLLVCRQIQNEFHRVLNWNVYFSKNRRKTGIFRSPRFRPTTLFSRFSLSRIKVMKVDRRCMYREIVLEVIEVIEGEWFAAARFKDSLLQKGTRDLYNCLQRCKCYNCFCTSDLPHYPSFHGEETANAAVSRQCRIED